MWDAAKAKPGNKGKLHRMARTATAPNNLGAAPAANSSGKINGFNEESFRQVSSSCAQISLSKK